jgi:ubiquinone/menaquinone biosynthesis C-methylase UbiE
MHNENMIQRMAAFYNRTEQYHKLGYDRLAAADFVSKAGGPLSGPALDIGTGKGLMAMALARQDLDVISVDTDAEEQALAALLAAEAGLDDRIRFFHGDASGLVFLDNHFGCAVLMDVLHHLENPVPVLEETVRVLKPSGVLILADFAPEGFALIAKIHQKEGRVHPVSRVTLEWAEALLSRKGFQPTIHLSGHKHEVNVLVKNSARQKAEQ